MKESGFYVVADDLEHTYSLLTDCRKIVVILDDGTELELGIRNFADGSILWINKDTTTGKSKWLTITPRASNAIEVS